MYTYREPNETQLIVNKTIEGETIEDKVKRMIYDKEPIKDGSTLIFTERKDGVNPAYNIRTDRWEIAVDAMDKIMKSKQAKRDDLIKKAEAEKEVKVINITDGKTESLQGRVSEK